MRILLSRFAHGPRPRKNPRLSSHPIAALAGSALAILAGPFASPANADPRETASKIEAVTVYLDGAVVTRGATIDLDGGPAVLAFKDLPNDLDPASLRVAATADATLTIESVASHLSPAIGKANGAADAQLADLKSRREEVQVLLDALEAKKAMALRFSKLAPKDLSNDKQPLAISDWPQAFDAVAASLIKTGDELRVQHAKARELDATIKSFEADVVGTDARFGPHREIDVELRAGTALKGHVTLTYRVAHAGWRPIYDARLETGSATSKPALEFVRRAAVSQATGEDWTDVALTVSTLRPSRSTAAPDMEAQRLVFLEPPTVSPAAPQAYARKSRALQADKAEAPRAAAPAPEPAPPQQAATESENQLEANAFQASFAIPGRINLAADADSKTFSISSRRVAPEMIVKSVPALDQTAYLETHFVNDDEAPLLPGEVVLHRDGTYVGKGSVDLVAPGDGWDLGFGADDRVKISRVPVKRKENEPNWLGQTKTEAREFKTIVKNLHDGPMKISIVDQIPISENTAITVEQFSATTPPTERNPTERSSADKRGVMGWTYDYEAGQTREIHLAYRMKWPADRDVTKENFSSLAK
jgi:uncharacterized protein (TIGR02231 family)